MTSGWESVDEREVFKISGPVHLTTVDWENAHHRRSVAASLVQGVKILERDRQKKRQGPKALADPWWEFFHFRLHHQLIDDANSSIFGAIYEFNPPTSNYHTVTQDTPIYVIAFRGTIKKIGSISQDLKLDLRCILSGLHRSSRFKIAMEAVQNFVARVGDLNIWLAGHSLGSAMAMLTGKNMAKMGTFLETFLFNPPFISVPFEMIRDEKLKQRLRIAKSIITAGVTIAVKNHQSEDLFVGLAAWVPYLFVNPDDFICSGYMGYFEDRNKMEEIGVGGIGRLATQNSIGSLLSSAIGKESEPLHLLPSANLTINLSPSPDFKRAHGIRQWWNPDLKLQSKVYIYR